MELIGLGLLLVFAVVSVIFLTRGVFSRDLTRALKRVNQQEEALQEKADILEQRLAQMERDYQAKLKRGDGEAERLTQEAKQHAMNIRTAAIEEAKHRARQLLLEAEQDRTQWRQELAKEMNGKLVQRACESLQRLLPPNELAALHGTLTHELLEVLGRMDAAALRRHGVERIDVRTAQPLPAEAARRLNEWAVLSLGTTVPVQVETDPALIAGCVVRIGSTIVDNSLANRLNQP